MTPVARGVARRQHERAPENFETLLGLEGVGAKTLRAVALATEVIYGTAPSMHRAMARAKVDRSEKVDALKRLGRFARSTEPRTS